MKQSFVSLLKEYYGVRTYKELASSLIEDFFMSAFLFSGSGLLTSIVKGLIGHLFIKSKYPLLIGKRTKIVHPFHLALGRYVRIKDEAAIIANGKITIGNHVLIGERSTLWSDKNQLRIGDDVTIGKSCYIAQLGGTIKIGDNVLIGDHVKMYTKNHIYKDAKIPINEQGFIETALTIEDNVLIGSGVSIFNNVTIGKGALVGANSVVNKDIPPYTVVGGVPAKFIKKIK